MSGNRINPVFPVVFALLLLCGLAACDPQGRTRRTPPTTEQPPENGEPKDGPIVDVPDTDVLPDTFIVDELDPERISSADIPIGPSGAQLSVMLPFFSNRFANTTQDLPADVSWALEYYAGMRMAVDELEREGERGVLHVFDTQGDAGASAMLIDDPELRNSHALIAPYMTTGVRAVVAPAQAAGLPLLVPFSAASNIARDYPRLVQLNPPLLRHLDAMAVFLNDSYDPSQVVLVGLPNGAQNQQVAYLLKRQRELNPTARKFRTWQLSTSDVGLQGLAWEDKFAEDQETVFVFPAYRNPRIVLSFLSQLQIGRAGRPATVLGMPQWSEFNQLDPSILEDLQVKITGGLVVDQDNMDSRAFETRYVDRYNKIPGLSAYLGYDAVRLALPLANEHGRIWTEHLPERYRGLAAEYVFQAVYDGVAPSEEEASPDYFENASVSLLEYRNFSFRPILR